MKPKFPAFPSNLVLSSSAMLAVLAMSSSAHGQSWDGGGTTISWGTADNWNPNGLPGFTTSTDLVFDNLIKPDNNIGGNRIVKSISYGPAMDGPFLTNTRTYDGGTAATLTFQAATGNATLSVDTDATGNLNLGWNGVGTAGGSIAMGSNLDIIHNGSGTLTFSRGISGANGFTKTGNGTWVVANYPSNTFTGAANFNGGRAIFGNTSAATGDLGAASAINLGGGILEIQTNGITKTISPPTTVSAASTLAYNNTTATNRQLLLNTGSMVLNADLTVQNISTDTSLDNVINISRNLTGPILNAGNVIVETYNNVNSETANFALGRVAFGGANSGWSGDLVIRQGTAMVFGDSSLGQVNAGTGDIILGETGNASGAGFLTTSSNGGAKTIANDIIVRTGGFRTIRGGSDHVYTFSGTVSLEGELNVHNGLYYFDKYMSLTGNISGVGHLNATKVSGGGNIRLSGDNHLWSGGLSISQGTVEIRGTSDTSAGTGLITIGATADTNAAVLTFVPGATGGSSLTYENNITVTTGGSRTINGGDTNHNVTLEGDITLNGNLTVNHAWSTADRRFNFDGPISGDGGLTVTRTYGNAETTLRMAGTNTYSGDTTVAASASLALAGTCSLAATSDVLVQALGRIGGPGTIGGNLTLEDTANFYFYAVGLDETTYVPMKVDGTVTLSNNFGIASLVGGSRGEAVRWATTPAGTYTLIGSTASTFNTGGSTNNIQNFGVANAATGLAGGRTAYFKNGGGTGSGGLQIVIDSGYAAWQVANGNTTSGFEEDHDGDGVTNGMELFLAGSTNSTGFNALPGVVDTAGVLSVTWVKGATYGGAYTTDFVVETSDTLEAGSWVPAVTNIADNTPGTVYLNGNNVKYTFPTSGPQKFARLKVTGP